MVQRQSHCGGGADPQENFEENECFWRIFQRSRGRAIAGVMGQSLRKIKKKMSAFEPFPAVGAEYEAGAKNGDEPGAGA